MPKKYLFIFLLIIVVCLSSFLLFRNNNNTISIAIFENYITGQVFEITKEEDLEKINTALNKINWKKNSSVEMARKEDALLTVTFKNKENTSLRIWINSNSKLEFINSNNIYGTLEGNSAKKIIKFLK